MTVTDHVPFALPIGTLIAGYEITRVLGAGGFGITYEGYNPVTKRKAAIKEFFPRGIASRDNATQVVYAQEEAAIVDWALDRFRRSTTELCEFKHPNIVPVLNYVPAHETGYMFMEQVEGETLEQWLRDKGDKVTFAEIREIIDPVCDALEYVHSRKFIHRDIAPDNIMIRKDGCPMLIDFGAIKIIAQQTQVRAGGAYAKSFAVAKQHYSPPEQLDQDAALDPRADVYALGAVLYRAVAGHPPVDADKRKNNLILKGADSYVPVAGAARITIPAGAAEAIDKALSLKPEHRQGSIAELRAALNGNAAETELVRATQPLKPDPMPTPGFTGPQVQQPMPGAGGTAGASTHAAGPATPAVGIAAAAALSSSGDHMAPRKSRSWLGIGAIVTVGVIVLGIFVASAFRPQHADIPDETPPQTQPIQQQQPPSQPLQQQPPTRTQPPIERNDNPLREGEKDTGGYN